jgi:DNA-binding HxlR family transcriptional regulator
LEHAAKRVKAIFSVIASSSRLEILHRLNTKGSLSYSELKALAGFRAKKESGKFAYHLRRLVKHQLVSHDRAEKKYSITNLGKTVLMLAKQIEEQSVLGGSRIYVRTSKYMLEEFKLDKIVQSLVKEGGMSLDMAYKIAAEAESRLSRSQTTYVTAPLIREMVNAILLEMGLEEYRHKLARVGLPVADVSDLFDYIARQEKTVSDLMDQAAQRVMSDYLLHSQLSRTVADAYMSGELGIARLGHWALKSDTLFVDLSALPYDQRVIKASFLERPTSLDDVWRNLVMTTAYAAREASFEVQVTNLMECIKPFDAGRAEIQHGLARALKDIQFQLEMQPSDVIASIEVAAGEEGVLEAYEAYLSTVQKPRVGLVINFDGPKEPLIRRGVEIVQNGGLITFTRSPVKTSLIGVKHIVEEPSGPVVGFLHGLSINLPRLALEAEGDETYFRAKLAMLARLAVEAAALRQKRLRDIGGKGLLPLLSISSTSREFPTAINTVGMLEAIRFLRGAGELKPQHIGEEIERVVEIIGKVSKEEISDGAGISILADGEAKRLYELDLNRYGRKVETLLFETEDHYLSMINVTRREMARADSLEMLKNIVSGVNRGVTVTLDMRMKLDSGNTTDFLEEAFNKLPLFTSRLKVYVCRNCGQRYILQQNRCNRCRQSFFTSYNTLRWLTDIES